MSPKIYIIKHSSRKNRSKRILKKVYKISISTLTTEKYNKVKYLTKRDTLVIGIEKAKIMKEARCMKKSIKI